MQEDATFVAEFSTKGRDRREGIVNLLPVHLRRNLTIERYVVCGPVASQRDRSLWAPGTPWWINLIWLREYRVHGVVHLSPVTRLIRMDDFQSIQPISVAQFAHETGKQPQKYR
jgi:hypothetical protein